MISLGKDTTFQSEKFRSVALSRVRFMMKMRYKGNSLTVPLVPRCVVRKGCFSVIVLGKVRENGGIGQIKNNTTKKVHKKGV